MLPLSSQPPPYCERQACGGMKPVAGGSPPQHMLPLSQGTSGSRQDDSFLSLHLVSLCSASSSSVCQRVTDYCPDSFLCTEWSRMSGWVHEIFSTVCGPATDTVVLLYIRNELTSALGADLVYKSYVHSLMTPTATPRLSQVDRGEDL